MARIIDHKVYPFARGSLTTGTQFSTLVTGADDTYADVEVVYVNVPESSGLGRVLEYEFNLIGQFQSSGTADGVNFKWQARNAGDDTWVDLCAAATIAADASVLASHTRKGFVAPQTNLNQPSIEVKCVVKSNTTAAESAAAKTASTSYVRIVYEQ